MTFKKNISVKTPGLEDAVKGIEEVIPLSSVSGGKSAKVVSIHGGKQSEHRMAEMGIIKDVIIQVNINRFAGPVICRIKGAKMALGHNLTRKILVKLIE